MNEFNVIQIMTIKSKRYNAQLKSDFTYQLIRIIVIIITTYR
jgi:hypothetical protein